jgi:hypothetical protein
MSDSGLRRALLDGLEPTDWYRILNKKVFFWVTVDRLRKLRKAREYTAYRQTLLVIDTQRLLASHSDRVVLSPMNSGCTKPFPHPRGRRTFLSVAEYPYAERVGRGLEPVVELAVDYMVEDVESFVVSSMETGGGRADQKILGSTRDIEALLEGLNRDH